MSLSIGGIGGVDSVNSLYGVNGLTKTGSQAKTETVASKEKATDADSYISTIAGIDPNAAIPSENYNDLGRQIQLSSKIGTITDATEYSSVSSIASDTLSIGSMEGASGADAISGTEEAGSAQGGGAVGGAGGGGGSEESDDDEETEVELVTINGQTYLQTTTTDSNGNTTVTRVPVGGISTDEENGGATAGSGIAAQLLQDL